MPTALDAASNTSESSLIASLKLIDPFLIFLTKKSGHISIPLATLAKALPPPLITPQLLQDIQHLVQFGVLKFHKRNDSLEFGLSWSDAETFLGFPSPADSADVTSVEKNARHDLGSLHGSTKTGAKRRVKALLHLLEQQRKQQESQADETVGDTSVESANQTTPQSATGAIGGVSHATQQFTGTAITASIPHITPDKLCRNSMLPVAAPNDAIDQTGPEAIRAKQDLEFLLGFSAKQPSIKSSNEKSSMPTCILDQQVSFAGTHPAQQSVFEELSASAMEQIPQALLQAFGLVAGRSQQSPRKLYRHQARAIEAALAETHCTVCTGTGSGKSMCFLVPVLTAAYQADRVSLILYPTKALAQDQLTQLQSLVNADPDLASRIRPATLDGDTPHSTRTVVADTCNVILTNPDTLHASILPNWRYMYSKLLSRLSYVALDEAHLYEGVFGAHVAMILSRLLRISVAAANHQGLPPSLPTFIATSATMPWPEELFRTLCPIAKDAPVRVLSAEHDGSPRSAKHFFLWNPPLLTTTDHSCTGQVSKGTDATSSQKRKQDCIHDSHGGSDTLQPWNATERTYLGNNQSAKRNMYRRHAAEETALILARALVTGLRCIAFCKTRNLVEWVYERTVATLKLSPSTVHLVEKLESYRGGYSRQERREIEQKLFRGDILGVVGTNALELGVDIGGINLTLHCGYPSSYSSLLQQAGRAGRDKKAIDVASCSVVICFDSPVEQHLWRHPRSLLSHGIAPSCSIPITSGLVQSHMLCASEEFPLAKDKPVSFVLGEQDIACLSDKDLFGDDVFDEAFEELCCTRGLVKKETNAPNGSPLDIYEAHVSHRKPWAKVSIRAIEPVNYTLVNVSHPGQGGRMDAVHDEGAVMDTIPYSRVFYYSHPGAIILHRGTRFKIIAMSTPPPVCKEKSQQRGNLFLAAFAKPTQARYFTRPLSHTQITIVKTLHRLEVVRPESETSIDAAIDPGDIETNEHMTAENSEGSLQHSVLSFAGCGTITVKRQIRGYAKLSLVTRQEISKSELTLPEFEYDTFGVWLDVDRDALLPRLGDRFGAGVHALSHALLAVAPIFVPGLVRQDLECDHSYFMPTRIMLFDERAGGSGACQRLWNVLFHPAGVIEAAVALLEDCRSCSSDGSYDGGCPACLQASNCLNFNLHLSRSAGAVIGMHLLERLQLTKNLLRHVQTADDKPPKDSTPRRKARERGLRTAKEMYAARGRQFVVGRPAWPLA